MERIPVAGPWITQKEIDYVTDAVTSAWFENANTYNDRFEKAFASYVGRQFAITLPSCTSGLHLALAASGVGSGDEVILPDATWIASSAPVTYVGANPVFADIDADTWCLSAASLAETITERTKAVIAVNLYGGMPDMGAIEDVCARHGIVLIEDAAESIGSRYKGKSAGSFGAASVFSFHGSKTLTTGEGGMLVTDDEDLFRRCLFLRDHGRQPGDKMFLNTEVAFKYKMSSMQAALGLAQLERCDELVRRKREIFDWYRNALADIDGVTLNHEPADVRNSYWMVTAVVDPRYGLDKADLMKLMSDRNVDCRPFFSPLSSIPAYRDLPQAVAASGRNVTAYRITRTGINLPSGFNMDREKVDYVCRQFSEILAGCETEERAAL